MPPKMTPTAKKVKKTSKASSTGRLQKVSTRATKAKAQMGDSFLLPTIRPSSNHHNTANSPCEIAHTSSSSTQEQHKALAQRVSVIAASSNPANVSDTCTTYHILVQASQPQDLLPPNDHLQPMDYAMDAPTLDMLRAQPSATQAADYYIDQLGSSVRRRTLSTANQRKSGRFNSSE